ncbi:terminase large subunit domain-containing protein [Varunaivibrio sulfuroxidans]|uniref:Phage FluMu gp28-like protein n=1 Tax=Varunaivibrio sulfuroxidans TaxID=1773489 RepID=A0A4R3JBB2_9PROT|nr:terminase family protein [Varunaivibrio sulfuroxidans]TCS62575.1 phage FluMu gp28-like protein [Varunaivibrio sulfuroxidans]WES30756.1 terminase family protein [Varunaivibrio sulfuroxidans]
MDAVKGFLAYQQRALAAIFASAVVVIEKSRRIGMTWALAAVAVLHAAAAKTAGGMNVFYMGYNLEMAREFIDTCAWWAGLFDQAARAVEEIVIKDEGKDVLAFRIKFASGFEVVALPSNPRSLRGMQGLVILDEAAFHDNLDEVLKAAFALLIWGGKVVVCSTHNGDAGAFNVLVGDVRAGRKNYRLIRTDFDAALADGLYKRICETQGKAWSAEAEAAWRGEIINFYGDGADEELFCIPAQGSGTFISAALIEARMDAAAPVVRWAQPAGFAELADHLREAECRDFCARELSPILENLDPALRHVIGEDFGRSGDLTVLWPLAVDQSLIRRTPFVVELRNIPFKQQEQILYYICDRLPRFGAGAFDARGNGQYLAERAMQRYGAGRIYQVMLSAEWYRENMPPYKAAFEDGAIALPKDADILADHRAIVMDRGVARIPENARTKDKQGGRRHGDSAIAGALAHFASRQDAMEYDYTAAPPPGRDGAADGLVGRARFNAKGAW